MNLCQPSQKSPLRNGSPPSSKRVKVYNGIDRKVDYVALGNWDKVAPYDWTNFQFQYSTVCQLDIISYEEIRSLVCNLDSRPRDCVWSSHWVSTANLGSL